MSSKNDYTTAVYASMYTLQLTLDEGLASKVVFLKLIAVCDNSILKAIGEHALCLKYLDLSGSWNVDEIGLQNLLFKNDMCLDTNSTSNDKLCQQLSQLYDNKSLLNHCCFTLEELRIQDTNTEVAGLLMILACVKSLKALGGFLYFRNIGDALVSIWKNSPKPRVFQLTELFDMQLSDSKIAIFKECMPHLNKLYTRLSCVYKPQDFTDLKQDSMFWGRVKILTIDLDYMSNEHFLKFLNSFGNNLSELIILDQETGIDVDKLLTICPNLLVLKGSLDIYNMPVDQFTKLKSIELRNSTIDAIDWIFENCPCLEEARLLNNPRDLNWNSQIFQKPSWYMCNNLKRLEFSLNNSSAITEYLSITSFIDKCLKLQHLGRIDGWCNPLLNLKVRNYVKIMNYDLNLY
ncbi:Hypothetical protein CINCED_3A006974 [Cinara cedri]|nr:Hypothetical protein CINCED_3A006974 [Cinara cedri]